MKIAVLDFGLSKTHRRFNMEYFRALSEFAELYIINSGSYYNELEEVDNIHIVEAGIDVNAQYNLPRNPVIRAVAARKLALSNMKKNRVIFEREKNFDYVLIMGYEVITFSLFKLYIPRGIPIVLFEHQQIDEISNLVKNLFFSLYKNKVNHIVMEETFKDFLINKKKVKRENVFVVHYLIRTMKVFDKKQKGERYSIIGISSNNDEKIISELVEEERRTQFLKDTNCNIVLRSKCTQYSDQYLKVENKFYSDAEYDSLFGKADAVLAASPKDFVHRMSGPVVNAIEAGKIVIGTESPQVVNFQRLSPNNFRIYKNFEELKNIILNGRFDIDVEELQFLQKRHSRENITKELKKCFQIGVD